MRERFELRLGEVGYPPQLAASPDPPKVLRGIGDPAALWPGIAVVGARKATPSGLAATRLFAGWAAEAGYVVISGAAIGCDQEAHSAALAADGPTVAVLACGADLDYPCGAAGLLGEMRGRDGACVVSEQPWGALPARWAFHRRNRIIATLAMGVLVVEARVPSGTFLTADFALGAGREVLAVPGSIFSAESRGPNRLIRNGATPVTEVSEFASELRSLLGPEPRPAGTPDHLRTTDDALEAAVAATPSRPDDLARCLGIDIVLVAGRLCSLEAAGRVKRFPDGRFGPIA